MPPNDPWNHCFGTCGGCIDGAVSPIPPSRSWVQGQNLDRAGTCPCTETFWGRWSGPAPSGIPVDRCRGMSLQVQALHLGAGVAYVRLPRQMPAGGSVGLVSRVRPVQAVRPLCMARLARDFWCRYQILGKSLIQSDWSLLAPVMASGLPVRQSTSVLNEMFECADSRSKSLTFWSRANSVD